MNLEKYLKYVVYGGLFASLFIPFLITESLFFPFITGKNFAFRILTEISFGAWAILALKNVQYRPKRNLLVWSMTAFVGIIFVADIFGADFGKSFWSNFERMEGFVTLLHFWAYFIILISVLKTKSLWDKFLNTTLAASVIVGLRGFLQLFGFFVSTQSGNRLDASFGNAAYLGAFMLFNVFIALYLLSKNWENKKWRWVYLSVAVFDAFLLFFSATRGAILGLVGGLILTAIIVAWFERENQKLKKAATIGIGVILVLLGLFFALKNTPVVQKVEPLRRIAEISLDDRTTQSRFLVWGIAYEGFKEKPILGWGQGNFTFVFDKYYNPEMYAQEPWFDRAHNIFFDWLVAGGALGLLAYLSVFLSALWLVWKKSNFTILQTGLFTGLLAGYFFQNLFVFDNVTTYILFAIVLSYIYFTSRGKTEVTEGEQKTAILSPQVATPIVALLVIFSIYFFNIPGIRASGLLIDALSAQSEGLNKNIDLYQKAISLDTYGTTEIRERLANSAQTAQTLGGATPDVKQRFISVAKEEMIKQVEEHPKSLRNTLLLSNFLTQQGFFDEALPYLERAKEISPRKQQVYFELTSLYLSTREIDKAVEAAKTAYELAPEFDNARVIYAVTLIYDGRAQAAQDLLEAGFGLRIYPDQRLARAYLQNGLSNGAIQTWQALIERDPTNVNYRFALASTYLQIGQRENAVRTLEAILEVDPGLAEQVNYYISEIRAGRNP